MTSGTMGLSDGYAPHLMDMVDVLFEVWTNVMPTVVRNYW
jgi:hypothetical protein